MGKLHTLRRAIEREPSAFTRWGRASGAKFRKSDRRWIPTHYSWTGLPYRSFVVHVLNQINRNKHAGVGNADDGQDDAEQ